MLVESALRRFCLLIALLVGSASAPAWASPNVAPLARPEVTKGVALGLHFQDPEASYEGYLWEIARTGADTVSLVVSWSQADVRATELAPKPGETPPD